MTDTDEIRRRWNAPPEILYARQDKNSLIFDGKELRGGTEVGFSPDTIQRMREDRMCPACWEPFEKPGPARCTLCGLGKKERRKLFEGAFAGEVIEGEDFGSRIDWRGEVDRLDAELERDNWAEHPRLGIVIPKGVREGA